MKNVEQVTSGGSGMPVYRVPVPGAPPRKGYALRLVSGMEEVETVKPGYWLWVSDDGRKFEFVPELRFHYPEDKESDARKASEILKQRHNIETEVVKVGF